MPRNPQILATIEESLAKSGMTFPADAATGVYDALKAAGHILRPAVFKSEERPHAFQPYAQSTGYDSCVRCGRLPDHALHATA